MNGIRYKQYAPHANLSKYIYCYWSLESVNQEILEQGVYEKYFPLGLPELIITYKGRYFEVDNNKLNLMPDSIIAGLQDQPRYFYHHGVLGLFSVVFQPYVLPSILDLSADQLANRIIPTSQLGEKIDRLSRRLLQTHNNEERVRIANQFFMREQFFNEKWDIPIEAILQNMVSLNGNLSVSQMAGDFGMSVSKMERQFKSLVGFTPRQYSKIIRFTRILNHYESIPQWDQLIAETGFYDQAHFIREFKKFTGMSPKAYYDARKGMVEHSILHDADFVQYNHLY